MVWKWKINYKHRVKNQKSFVNWDDYFNDPLKRKVDVEETEMQFVSNTVRLCISNLPDGNAGGVDGILNEMLKCTNDIITQFLTLLFNKILLRGEYPNMWCKATICPILKAATRSSQIITEV